MGGGWGLPVVHEPFTGAWQRNLEQRVDTTATYYAVWACVTLIASDVSKVRVKLVEQLEPGGTWSEVTRTNPFAAVLTKPNRYQNRIEFFEQWMISKLLHGNTYVLKERDERGVVTAMYILDPLRTKALVAPDGAVMYQLSKDNLAGIDDDTVVIPASEVIHDKNSPLFHPLCGISPLTACGLAAMQGMSILDTSFKFFLNGARPGGLLTAPHKISADTAERLRADWTSKFSGTNAGRIAVLGEGLKYESMTVNADDAQLVEQLKMSAEIVCSAFHVPAHKINVGQPPNYNNIEALDQAYYSQCIQSQFEKIELCLDEGLDLVKVIGRRYGVEFEISGLVRMDTTAKVKAAADAVRAGIATINEARADFDRPPVDGGDTTYLQEQNWPLRLLADRELPAAAPTPPAPMDPPAPAPQEPPETERALRRDGLTKDGMSSIAASELILRLRAAA
jgi:HK97 family phage portal protein